MEEEKKVGRPALVEVYCLCGNLKTSKGRLFHGDRVKLPKEEAEDLKAKYMVE